MLLQELRAHGDSHAGSVCRPFFMMTGGLPLDPQLSEIHFLTSFLDEQQLFIQPRLVYRLL